MERDTIIVVGVTRIDTYGNLWVTPSGGGDEVKIGSKRSHLHGLFEQGKAVMLHWEVYKNKPYVSDAKLVEGELPEPPDTELLPEHQKVIDEARQSVREKVQRPQGTNESIESQVAFKGLIELIVADKIQIDGLVGKWALAWAMGKLGAVPEDIQKLAKATKSKGKEE